MNKKIQILIISLLGIAIILLAAAVVGIYKKDRTPTRHENVESTIDSDDEERSEHVEKSRISRPANAHPGQSVVDPAVEPAEQPAVSPIETQAAAAYGIYDLDAEYDCPICWGTNQAGATNLMEADLIGPHSDCWACRGRRKVTGRQFVKVINIAMSMHGVIPEELLK